MHQKNKKRPKDGPGEKVKKGGAGHPTVDPDAKINPEKENETEKNRKTPPPK